MSGARQVRISTEQVPSLPSVEPSIRRSSCKRAWLVCFPSPSHWSRLPAVAAAAAAAPLSLADPALLAISLCVGTSILKNPVSIFQLPWLRPRWAVLRLCPPLSYPALIVFNSQVRSCTVSGAASQQRRQQHLARRVCCLLIMIMMIEIVFSPSPLFGIFLYRFFLFYFVFRVYIYVMLCPFVAAAIMVVLLSASRAVAAVCVCRFAAHLFRFTPEYRERNKWLLAVY